jgi:hypothetical protein
MNQNHLKLAGILAIVSFILMGCAGNLPEPERFRILSSQWGRSFESAKRNQILNPEAAGNQDPVVGLDGPATETTVDRYRKSFEQEKKREVRSNLGL